MGGTLGTKSSSKIESIEGMSSFSSSFSFSVNGR